MRVVVVVALALTSLATAAWLRPAATSLLAPPRPPPSSPDRYSNIAAADYVGPAVCGECHAKNHGRWQAGLHAAMNRVATAPGALRGDFSGPIVRYAGGRATFDRDRSGPRMTLAAPGAPARRYRVTRTIGSRYLQEYVGVPLDGGGAATGAAEIRLPFGYWLRAGRWLPQPFYDSWFPAEIDGERYAFDAYHPDPAPWATRCAWCHNTYPFELRALRESERAVGYGFEQYVSLPVDRFSAAERRAVAQDNRLPDGALVTVGISCESCHLGGREHATSGAAIRFVPSGAGLVRRPGAPGLDGGRKNPVVVTTICAQCHSTPTPRFASGAAARNSSEALDLVGGACASAITCTDCHDPHVAGPGPGAPDQPGHLAACVGCHAALATPAAARAHARHRPEDASCLDCHMPRIVQGISSVVRSHHISSPADPAELGPAAANACNLCHLDRSRRWTLGALARGWGVRPPLDPRGRAAGRDLDAPLGPAWLAGDSAALRLVAAAAYGRSPLGRAALPLLIARLDDPVAHDRMRLLFAIEDLLGRRLRRAEYDPLAPPAARAAAAAGLRARWPLPSPGD